jgi:hypothetical protein
MSPEKIKETMEAYNLLINEAELIALKLEALDSDYNTKAGINAIYIQETDVLVECLNYEKTPASNFYLRFPLSYLSLSNDQLLKTVYQKIIEKQDKLLATKKQLEADKILREKEEYERLKKKFG